MANNAKGNARPTEKPNMPIVGPNKPPRPAKTNNGPTIGPVQEKDTITNVRAMKKMPPKVPVPALASVLLVHEEGRAISNAPRNEIPNMIKTAKKKRFAIQLVERLLRTLEPKMAEMSTPRTVNMII